MPSSCRLIILADTLAAAGKLCVSAIPSLVESRASELSAYIATIMVLAILSVLLRLFARSISGAKLRWDDFFIILALVMTIGLDINSFYSIKYGAGRHMITLTLDEITSFVKTDQATQILFGCSITALKLSILFFYHRIFAFRNFAFLLKVVGILNILWWVGLVLTGFLHCRPLAYYWDRSIPGGVCADEHVIGYSITAIDIVFSIAILILPIPWLWSSHMAPIKKLAVNLLFILGSL